MVKELKEGNKKESSKLRRLKPIEYNRIKTTKFFPDEIWRSNRFAVQIFYGKFLRLSVCRTMINKEGEWIDGITWNELQEIKNKCGFENKTAVEVYPPIKDLVDVANIRHLIILNEMPEYLWSNNED